MYFPEDLLPEGGNAPADDLPVGSYHTGGDLWQAPDRLV